MSYGAAGFICVFVFYFLCSWRGWIEDSFERGCVAIFVFVFWPVFLFVLCFMAASWLGNLVRVRFFR